MLSLLLNYYEGFLKDEFEYEECFVLFSASESILAVNEPTRTKFWPLTAASFLNVSESIWNTPQLPSL